MSARKLRLRGWTVQDTADLVTNDIEQLLENVTPKARALIIEALVSGKRQIKAELPLKIKVAS